MLRPNDVLDIDVAITGRVERTPAAASGEQVDFNLAVAVQVRNPVRSRAAIEQVGAGTSLQDVVPGLAAHEVVAVSAEQMVVAVPASQVVVVVSALEAICTGIAEYRIDPESPDDPLESTQRRRAGSAQGARLKVDDAGPACYDVVEAPATR